MVPLFDFLKKKGKVKPAKLADSQNVSNNKSENTDNGVSTDNSPNAESLQASQRTVTENNKRISISEALLLLRSQDEIKFKEFIAALLPIKASVEKLLKSTEKIADDLEEENIKIEEPRFESIVENSRRTIISSLRKESSSEINSIVTLDDAIKFNARLESIVNRFSALSGSHSRVLNAFVKKYASKLQSESNTVSNLSRKSKSVVTEYQTFRESVVKTEWLLKSLDDQINSIKNGRDSIDNFGSETRRLQGKIEAHVTELHNLEGRKEYLEISSIEKEIEHLEKEEQEIRQQTVDLFGHVNRAITKYSYGLPTKKELFTKLQTLATEPWRIYYLKGSISLPVSSHRSHSPKYDVQKEQSKEDDSDDFFQYLSVLREIQASITKGNIDLKDSEKVVYYLDQILELLPNFYSRLEGISARKHYLREHKNSLQIFSKINVLEGTIKVGNETINENRKKLDILQSELTEKQRDLNDLASRSQTELFKVVGKHFEITM